MEYTVKKLAKLAGVSTRTLRYYDQIGLLSPKRVSSNGYRIYGQAEIDLLQQILFYREMGMPLEEIGRILNTPGYDREMALEQHLSALMQKRQQLEMLIDNVTKTISTLKGETMMTDEEKFKGFAETIVKENEMRYGKEIREKYGEETVDACNEKVRKMTAQQWQQAQELDLQIKETLKAACEQGDPAGKMAEKLCELHRRWLCMFWKEGMYTKEMHCNLAEMYVTDERFASYYNEVVPGGALFLRDAVREHLHKNGN